MNYKFSLTRLTRSAKFKCWGSIKTQILINRILNKTEVQHFFAFFFSCTFIDSEYWFSIT